MADEFPQLLLKIRTHLLFDPLHQFFFLNDLKISQSCGRRHWMARVGEAMGKVPPLHQDIGDRLGDHRGPHGDISTGQPFRQNHQIGLQIPHLTDKPSSQTSKRRDHFVHNEKDFILPC